MLTELSCDVCSRVHQGIRELDVGLLLLLGGLGLLGMPGFTRRLGKRLVPAEWARLCGLALFTGAVIVELAAVVYAAPTVLSGVGLPALAEACDRVIGPIVPGGPLAGWAGFVASVVMPVGVVGAALRSRRSSRKLWIEPCVGVHSAHGWVEIVELPTDRLLAVSVPTPGPQIIVSRGLSQALSPDEFQAVVDHERAHLELHHHRFLLLAAALEAGLRFIPLRPSAGALRAAVERWADEEAAGSCPKARAQMRSALLRVTSAVVSPGVASFTTADSVVERLDALASPPRQPSLLAHSVLYAPGALVGGVVVAALGAMAGTAHVLAAVTAHCPV